jgi:hypothetical protein
MPAQLCIHRIYTPEFQVQRRSALSQYGSHANLSVRQCFDNLGRGERGESGVPRMGQTSGASLTSRKVGQVAGRVGGNS